MHSCNCFDLPDVVADVQYYNCGFKFAGLASHGKHFDVPESDCFLPKLDDNHTMYRCLVCEQCWYIECSPEQSPSPIFAIKVSEIDAHPSEAVIYAAKSKLCVMAHGGFSTEKCRTLGCQHPALIGRALCHLHIGSIF